MLSNSKCSRNVNVYLMTTYLGFQNQKQVFFEMNETILQPYSQSFNLTLNFNRILLFYSTANLIQSLCLNRKGSNLYQEDILPISFKRLNVCTKHKNGSVWSRERRLLIKE